MIIKVTETARQGQKERVRQTDGPTDREAQEERGKEASGGGQATDPMKKTTEKGKREAKRRQGGTGDRPNEKDDREREERSETVTLQRKMKRRQRKGIRD